MPSEGEIGEVRLQQHMDVVSGRAPGSESPFPDAYHPQVRELTPEQVGFAKRLRRVIEGRFSLHSQGSIENHPPQDTQSEDRI